MVAGAGPPSYVASSGPPAMVLRHLGHDGCLPGFLVLAGFRGLIQCHTHTGEGRVACARGSGSQPRGAPAPRADAGQGRGGAEWWL